MIIVIKIQKKLLKEFIELLNLIKKKEHVVYMIVQTKKKFTIVNTIKHLQILISIVINVMKDIVLILSITKELDVFLMSIRVL